MYQIKIYMVMILNRGYLLGLKDWSWSLSHEQRKKVFWFTYSTSDGAFYSQRNYTNPRRQVPPLRSRDQILVEIYDSEEKGFILPRFLWTISNFFFSPFLQGRQWRPICLQRRRAMGFERCCELGSWKVQDRSLHSVCSCEQFRGLDQTKAIK